MVLSYTLRLLCLIVVSTGILQALFELILWMYSPLILGLLAPLPARRHERLLYLLQLLPLLGASVVTIFFFVPQYLRTETNLMPETVSRLCLFLVVIVLAWFGFACMRGLRIAFETLLFMRACKRKGQSLGVLSDRTPILKLPESTPLVALVGLFHPFVGISRCVVDESNLDLTALNIIFEHEHSHIVHHDNWKLFSLHCLPSLNLRLSGSTWKELWRSTAEWAADEDAVHGDRERAFLLAETLIKLTRHQIPTRLPRIIRASFLYSGSELVDRIDRLTQERSTYSPRRYLVPFFAITATVVVIVGIVSALTPSLQDISERLLHLG